MKPIGTVECILKDKNNKTIGARIKVNGKTTNYPTEYLRKYRNAIILNNAILDINGFVRGKDGINLQTEILYKNQITLYHGSKNKVVTPQYGLGEDKHDYGRGFYLTPNKELASEWGNANNEIGYLHTYTLNLDDLKVVNLDNYCPLVWLAELMKHRAADNSVRYKKKSKEFIERYGLNLDNADVIKGYRADSSYFLIAKRFVRNELDYELLKESLYLGDLGIQYCIKSKKAFEALTESDKPQLIDEKYGKQYQDRDNHARDSLYALLESEKNTMEKSFDFVIAQDIKCRGEVEYEKQ